MRACAEIFALICSYLQPVGSDSPHYIYLPHAEDGRREILRRCPTAFSTVPGAMPRLEPPDSRYKAKQFSRTMYKFQEQKDGCVLRRAWPLLSVSRTLRRRFIDEIFSGHKYIVNMLDLEAFAYLAATPPLNDEEARDEVVPPLPQLRFCNVSVFVPTGEKLPQLPLQPFFALEQQGVSVSMVSQEAEERDPAMVSTIKRVKDFLAGLAREGEPLPSEYDKVHVFRGGALYVKPSFAYLKKYRLDRIPRTIFTRASLGLKLHDLLSDLRPLHALTGSTVWLDMKRNMYNKQYEYLDPSKEYEQSAVEYEDYDFIGDCVEQAFYTKGLGNFFILKEEAFGTFNTHLINCVHVPLRKSLSRRSYIRLFHSADDGNRAQPDEMRARFYEVLNNRGVHRCGKFCREYQAMKLERKIANGELTLEQLEGAISSYERDGDVAWDMHYEFCLTAEEKAVRARVLKSFRAPSENGSSSEKEDVREPSPDPEYDNDEAWRESKSQASDEENDADEEGSQIDSNEVDELWKDSGLSRPVPVKAKPVVRRPPEGYAPIELEACSDTSSLPGNDDDEADEEEGGMTDASSLIGNEREIRLRDPEYDNDRRWKVSERLQSEEADGGSDDEICIITANELRRIENTRRQAYAGVCEEEG